MPEQQVDLHAQLFEQIACSVCNKSPGISVEECFAISNKSLCQQDGKCRIFEKTEAQLRYICSPLEERVFLTACPGSGKTEVVGLKAAYETKRWEQKRSGIAFLTFTNNATSVISDRVIRVAGVDAVGYPHYIGTIDSWLHRYIAQPFGHLVSNYYGADGDGSIRIISGDVQAGWINNYACVSRYWFYGQNEQLRSKSIFANHISYDLYESCFYIRTGRYSYIRDVDYYHSRPFQEFRVDKGWLTLERFRQGLKECLENFHADGFATYRGIEIICYLVLKKPEILARLAKRFPIIIIDECQDLSKNQLVIVRQLIEAGVSVHFVGDLDQSIYSFKGVDPGAINAFVEENEFSNPELSDNFRSPQSIVDLCSRLVSKVEVVGQVPQGDAPICVYLAYEDDEGMANLPEIFSKILVARNEINIENSAILARNYNTIGKIRSHGNSGEKSIAYFPAIAIGAWNSQNRSLEQMEEAISLMGKYLTEKLFPAQSSNSRRYYCPESVSSPIQWRVFLARVLSECCDNAALVNFQQIWGEWAGSYRDSIEEILKQSASGFDTITLPDNIRDILRYRVPSGKRTEAVSISLDTLPDRERIDIRITTFHKIKGETLDAALVVSSPDMRGGGGGHWQKWLEDPASENARFAYVASSRPRHLLVWAVPEQGLDDDGKARLVELGFVENPEIG